MVNTGGKSLWRESCFVPLADSYKLKIELEKAKVCFSFPHFHLSGFFTSLLVLGTGK